MKKHNENGGEEEKDKCDENEVSNFLPETLKRGNINEPTWKETLNQVIASCIVHCIVIQAGVNMAYSTVLIGGLQANGNNVTAHNASNEIRTEQRIIIDENHESWIASLVTITLPIGSLVAGPLMDKLGRKTMCIFLCLPTAVSWILLILSNSLAMIYAARCIAGISAGLTSVGLVYVMEITHPRVRAMLLCLNSVFVSLGILLTCLFALWFDWRKMAILFLAIDFVIFIALFAIPESPYWLACFAEGLRDGDRTARAEKSLAWLNPSNWMYEQEYNRIKETCRNDRRSIADDSPAKTFFARCKYYTTELKRPIVYKPMILLLVVLLMQQLSGAYVVIFYAISVFREIGGTFGNDLDEYGALLLLGIIRFVMSILTAHLSRTIGRRVLCIASGLGMSFAMFFSAMFIYLTFAPGDDENATSMIAQQKWLLLVVVLFYVCMSTLGFVVIPWTLIGELLPITFRGIGGGIMISYAYIVMFAVVKSYPYALIALGPQNVFFFFSIMSLLGTSFVYLFLPETLGKSFKQIERYFDPDGDKNFEHDGNKSGNFSIVSIANN